MKKSLRMKFMLLLFALVVGSSNVWADDPTTLASLINNTTTGWTVSGATSTGTGTGLYWILTNSSYYIESPSITWSDYTSITIKIKARTYGGVEAAKNKISVSQGSTELTSYTPTGNTLTYSSELSISPSSGSLKIACLGANGTKGSGISEIIIKGVLASTGDETTIIIDASGVVNNIYGPNMDGGTFSATVYDSSDAEIEAATVTWSSSNETVATINSSTGAVTLNKVGSTTITASYAGVTNVYLSSTNTYNLVVVNENPALVTIWSEDFSGYSANAVPTGGTYSYACTNGNGTTKIYNEASTGGGAAPELLIGKNSGTFSATIALLSSYGYSGDLTLKYKTNAKSLNVKTTTDGITVDGEGATPGVGVTFSSIGEHTVTFKGITTETTDITIVFTATTNDNVRLDDIILKGLIAVPVNGSNEITSNVTIPVGATLSISSELIIPSGKILTVNGTLINDDPDNLVINDGGQLVASNSVAATVKKSIADPTKDGDYGHWYTISTPVHKDATDNVVISETNLTSVGSENYDMFAYDEENGKWLNQKKTYNNEEPPVQISAGFSNMTVGRGYLYRNNGTDLVITGNTNTGDAITYTLTKTGDGAISGFNLLGNPYPHDITLKHITYSKGDNLTGCYVLSNAGAWGSELAENATISSYQGFLVQADVDDKVATFHETAQRGAKSNGDNIKFMVANSQYEDVAYALFDKGFGLSKINHRNADIPMLYINQEDADYAIATMSDETKSFNLNFKAMTTGKYTLSYKADGNFSYLHVIDRLTGEDVDMLLEGEYSFIASPIDSENRFIVRLEYSAGSEISESSVFAYQSGNDIIVNGEGELQIFDMMGRRVLTQYVSGVETINLHLNGVYIFKLNEKTQKIVVK